jgi:uncharacterized membrane protein
MFSGSGRKPRCVAAIATYLNAGLWGSRFVGECEVSTNGERIWVKGYRVPAWVAIVRVISFILFVPVGFYTGVMVGQTMVGRWGYPPYYYLVSTLLTFLLVVLGLWGAGIWAESLGSYESVSWPVGQGQEIVRARFADSPVRSMLLMGNRLVSMSNLVQVQIPIGPHGKPRRLVLKADEREAGSLRLVLAGVYYGQTRTEGFETAGSWNDPWMGSRNN